MSKAVVCAFLAAAAFILFIVCSQTIKSIHKDYGPRGLSRRLGYKLPPPLFDPLVAKFAEQKGGLDDRHLTTTNGETTAAASKELRQEDMADFLSDDGRLNLTQRLEYLFPFLDMDPKDGFVELKELEAWIIQQAKDRLTHTTEKELASRDMDGDGAISFREYFPHEFSDEDLGNSTPVNVSLCISETQFNRQERNGLTERNGMGHGEAGWWKEQFKNADVDQDGNLSFHEFREPIDYDDDEKLDFAEFKDGAYEIYRNYVEFETGGANVPSPEEVFKKLDVNKDKLLGVEELKPIQQYLSPGELSYAKYYAGYLIHEADDNRDGKLDLDEMIMHDNIFYNTVYESGLFDDDDDFDDFHEEL
ncbi:hypothetical protein U1Q18_004787 [Sarracenia purpurea var. burkii]